MKIFYQVFRMGIILSLCLLNNIQLIQAQSPSNPQIKFLICHKGKTICVKEPAAQAHLENHPQDYLGPCNNDAAIQFPDFDLEEDEYSLVAYPNPFFESANLYFSSATNDRVRLTILNLLGDEIVTLFEGEIESELRYELRWDASALSPGIYFARYQSQQGKNAVLKLHLTN